MAEKRYKEINGVRYEVVPNPDMGSNVIPVAGSSDLPEIESGDGGKVLTVKEDESGTEWADAPTELPEVTSADAGDVLTVNASGEWEAAAPTELPEVTSADAGDVLTVNASGEWEAAAPSGGGGFLAVNLSYYDGSWHTDKTYSEMLTAINNGTPVIVNNRALAYLTQNDYIECFVPDYFDNGILYGNYMQVRSNETSGDLVTLSFSYPD